MQLESFLLKRFGHDAERLLKRMHTGGENNSKGTLYELQFTVARIFAIAALESNLDDFLISRQEAGFVDDIVLREKSRGVKRNYQARNSSGSTSKWSESLGRKFQLQQQLDLEFHGYEHSYQVLLVPDQARADQNNLAIPPEMRSYSASEFHPSADNSVALLCKNASVRSHVSKVCASNDLSDLDSAFRLVLSVCIDAPAVVSVGDFVGLARSISKPDLFSGTAPIRPGPPGWLLSKCAEFEGMKAEIKLGVYCVRYQGFEVTTGADLTEPDVAVLDGLDTPLKFMKFLMATLRHQLL